MMKSSRSLHCKSAKHNQKNVLRAISAAIEPLEDRVLMAVFTVVNANDSGDGSLRWAITQSNNTPGVDMIAFNIQGEAKTIYSSSELDLSYGLAHLV